MPRSNGCRSAGPRRSRRCKPSRDHVERVLKIPSRPGISGRRADPHDRHEGGAAVRFPRWMKKRIVHRNCKPVRALAPRKDQVGFSRMNPDAMVRRVFGVLGSRGCQGRARPRQKERKSTDRACGITPGRKSRFAGAPLSCNVRFFRTQVGKSLKARAGDAMGANFGIAGLDWQQRVNWGRLRDYRIGRARADEKARPGRDVVDVRRECPLCDRHADPRLEQAQAGPALRPAVRRRPAGPVRTGRPRRPDRGHSPWIPKETFAGRTPGSKAQPARLRRSRSTNSPSATAGNEGAASPA